MSNQMTPPLTPEMLEGIKQRCQGLTEDRWKWTPYSLLAGDDNIELATWNARNANDGDKKFIAHARTDIPLLLAHIESQARRVEEVEKFAVGKGIQTGELAFEIMFLRSQLSLAQEAIRVKDEALRLNHTYFCSYFEKFPCDCGVAEAKQKALSAAGSGEGDDKTNNQG